MQENYLCVDAGNSFTKAAIFTSNEMIRKEVFTNFQDLVSWLGDVTVTKAIISSVKSDEGLFAELFHSCPLTVFSYQLPLPVTNLYKTPETLGKDRLASVIGARYLFPEKNCLVIDAGTCITYDFLSAGGEYHGGAISPGLTMRFKALNHFTARLPLVSATTGSPLTGNDTTISILSGVQNGMLFEIQGAIREYSALYPDLQVIICGGDSLFFESKIKGGIFAFPDLVLIGLNHTLLYNALH